MMRWRADGLAILVAVAAATAIAMVQPGLARAAHAVTQREDVVALPPPEELRAMTLGYKNAAADLLWCKLVLEYGLHWQERRAFPDVHRYIDAIIAVEPDHPALYQFVDTMLLFTPNGAGEEEARQARAYLERGVKERPYDHELWLHYGQGIAFLATSFLKDPAEIGRWRHDGALAIAHAVELGADADRSLSVATILSKSGDKQAAIQHLQRAYAMADDPETRRQLGFKLERLDASIESERALAVVESEWHARYPFMTRTATLLLGPSRSAANCAGPVSYDRRDCPRDWSTAAP